jgi:hypothetical protein
LRRALQNLRQLINVNFIDSNYQKFLLFNRRRTSSANEIKLKASLRNLMSQTKIRIPTSLKDKACNLMLQEAAASFTWVPLKPTSVIPEILTQVAS